VLSGALDDGAAGLHAIKERGGVAVVQDPADALFPDMPRNAMEATEVDHCVPKNEIAALLERLTGEAVDQDAAPPVPEDMDKEIKHEAMDMSTIDDEDKPGTPSVYGCPDCGGVLWEMKDGEWLRFRCRVGHGYSAEGLLSAQTDGLDAALWSAFRSLEENASLARRLAERSRGSKRDALAKKFDERAEAAERQAETIKKVLLSEKLAGPLDKTKDTD